ncbi:aminotransferase class I/II-fold pyridoxal phosphate-dependent enzyme [Peribacillus kribbensis]|uniref:aminotransferase class I/II-fold pyridoxal phosphate-dependent enzyme n=1 Tax=Peribacillus kribbensis TaxID=356658 RepID=UPI001FE173ED|nr:aminotransferase class V-fold PLP-dependent enzyme [Peribacillus kribbensis]
MLKAIREFEEKAPVSFHVPGHKSGRVFNEAGYKYFQSVLPIDVTELTGLDDLHAAEGPIKEAETLLSDLYGADESHFLVNGTTSGNLAMILAVCSEGDVVIVQRNCHKSILHGLMLANAKPVFISPGYDPEMKTAGTVNFKEVEAALHRYPNAKALILTYPNYYGVGGDIEGIVEAAHERGTAVLVDEAHGAHFVLPGAFPDSALKAGADVVVQSAHKTLPAMTMGSYIHINGRLADAGRIRFYLQMIQSSSPSYPIMLSLDLARHYLAGYTEELADSLYRATEAFREGLRGIQDIKLVEPAAKADPLKVVIQSVKGYSGYDLQAALEQQGVYTELADPFNVLFVLPLGIEQMKEFEKVLTSIRKGIKEVRGTPSLDHPLKPHFPALAELAYSYREMDLRSIKYIPLKDSRGRIAAEFVTPYPPGIPLLLKGEKITDDHIEQLQSYLALGARFHGGERLGKGEIAVFI